MTATRFEYRFRFALHALIFILGFVAPWNFKWHLDHTHTAWEWLAAHLSDAGWLKIEPAFLTLLIIALALMAAGAALRVWGSAYVGAGVVASRDMHGNALLADGPYRRTRNPLYLGSLLHTLGISLLMPPTGAVFCVVLIWIFQIRLALAEEPFLAARFGESYIAYRNRVPRFLPALTPHVPAAGQKPQWLQAFMGEFYFVAVVFVMGVFGWQFEIDQHTMILRGILISLGVWFILRAFLPKPQN